MNLKTNSDDNKYFGKSKTIALILIILIFLGVNFYAISVYIRNSEGVVIDVLYLERPKEIVSVNIIGNVIYESGTPVKQTYLKINNGYGAITNDTGYFSIKNISLGDNQIKLGDSEYKFKINLSSDSKVLIEEKDENIYITIPDSTSTVQMLIIINEDKSIKIYRDMVITTNEGVKYGTENMVIVPDGTMYTDTVVIRGNEVLLSDGTKYTINKDVKITDSGKIYLISNNEEIGQTKFFNNGDNVKIFYDPTKTEKKTEETVYNTEGVTTTSQIEQSAKPSGSSSSGSTGTTVINNNPQPKAEGSVDVLEKTSVGWVQNATFNIFSNATSLRNVRKTNEGKVIVSPSSSGEYAFRITTMDYDNIAYALKFSDESELRQMPLVFRLKYDNGKYVFGQNGEWYTLDQISQFKINEDLSGDEFITYYLEWKWNTVSDSQDTYIGRNYGGKDIKLKVELVVSAW